MNHAVFPGPVKIADMERTSMYRDYLAQINGTSINTAATDEETPKNKFAVKGKRGQATFHLSLPL